MGGGLVVLKRSWQLPLPYTKRPVSSLNVGCGHADRRLDATDGYSHTVLALGRTGTERG
jgi:hypothetical protein